MEYCKKLYKKDSKGKIRVLFVSTDAGDLIQKSGLIDGKLIERASFRPGKNIGKSNETTCIEQAVLEAESIVTKKLREGYFLTEHEAKNTEVVLPMLAKVYEEEEHKIDWNNCWVQPKFDGMRCLSTLNEKTSRKNVPITTMDHIKINPTVIDDEGNIETYVVDGELYVHGESFQTNMKYVKKYRGGLSERIQYYIYDVISDRPFHERIKIASLIAMTGKNCQVVPTFKVSSKEQVLEYHKMFLMDGYEGTMVRWGNAKYNIDKRSSNLLKFKDFIDKTYTIVDVVPSDKDPEIGVIHCVDGNLGRTFGCGMKFSYEERAEILINKDEYIGQIAEIRFFEYTDDGLPRFPVCFGFRLDK